MLLWIEDSYPIAPRPRWGFGLPVHAGIQRTLEKSRATYEANIDELSRHRDALYAIPELAPQGTLGPFWNNVWFSCLDAASLVGFLLARKPKTYLEIGSGHSTLFARHAITWGKLPTKIVSVDPAPRAGIDALCDEAIRSPLEDVSLELFDRLEPGDVLFFDGTHRVFTNSDATAFFLEVLPRLRPGVLVHIHDVFLPSDYPAEWTNRYYSEQYLLGAMLVCGAPPFKVVLPNFFVCTDEQLAPRIKAIFDAKPSGRIPFVYEIAPPIPGVSFWVETV
jgi:predicted O-methyltransferase YrrM